MRIGSLYFTWTNLSLYFEVICYNYPEHEKTARTRKYLFTKRSLLSDMNGFWKNFVIWKKSLCINDYIWTISFKWLINNKGRGTFVIIRRLTTKKINDIYLFAEFGCHWTLWVMWLTLWSSGYKRGCLSYSLGRFLIWRKWYLGGRQRSFLSASSLENGSIWISVSICQKYIFFIYIHFSLIHNYIQTMLKISTFIWRQRHKTHACHYFLVFKVEISTIIDNIDLFHWLLSLGIFGCFD